MDDEQQLTPAQLRLERGLSEALDAKLAALGWEVLEDLGRWLRLARPGEPDEEAWLVVHELSVQPVVEPPLGSRVYLRAAGCTREGRVVWRGPGHIRATWVSASGNLHEDLVFQGDWVLADAYDAGRKAARLADLGEREAGC